MTVAKDDGLELLLETHAFTVKWAKTSPSNKYQPWFSFFFSFNPLFLTQIHTLTMKNLAWLFFTVNHNIFAYFNLWYVRSMEA